jgi:hypothetical protein
MQAQQMAMMQQGIGPAINQAGAMMKQGMANTEQAPAPAPEQGAA